MNFLAQFFWLTATPALAQVETGINQVGEQIALGGGDIRIIIARIINIALGFLGILAVVLILYGGLVWMTSGGDEEKVDKAKKILVSAVVGLAIILSAFAITRFVLSKLIEATTGEQAEVGRGGGPGGGGLPSGAFVVRSFQPNGAVPIRNVTVRVLMNLSVDSASLSLAGAFAVTDTRNNAVVPGVAAANGSVIEFTPDAPCPPPNEDRHCFESDVTYRVAVAPPLQSVGGRVITCGGIAPSCSATFTTGNLVDVSAPSRVEILDPDPGAQVPAESLVPVQVHAVDDAGISYIDITADGASVSQAAPPTPTADFTGVEDWDTAGVNAGTHRLGATAFDVDGNNAAAAPVDVVVRPLHCFNNEIDEGEVGLNCGGGGCGACAGGACAADGECASGVCRAGICVEVPEIRNINPGDGAVGNFITILGTHFGSTPGKILFGDREALLCSATAWTDQGIVAVVPEGAANGPITVAAANGETDRTDDARGPLIPDFVVNDTVRPGLCTASPARGRPGTEVVLTGQNFGDEAGALGVVLWSKFGGVDRASPTPAPENWNPTVIRAAVAAIAVVGETAGLVRVRTGSEDSNPVRFSVLPPEAGELPRVDSVEPGDGAPGDAVTILGDNFGNIAGTVLFNLPDGTSAIGDANFPPACSDRYWTNRAITIKVPSFYGAPGAPDRPAIQFGAHTLKVRRNDAAESNATAFSVEDAPPRPNLCLLDPDNGPAGTAVDLAGERFGALPGLVRFSQNQNAARVGRWSAESISDAVVPPDATTGPVRVSVAGRESNPILFEVGRCASDASCREGNVCCGDGVCRASCAGVGRIGGFSYRFSTGIIPRVPQVVESASCRGETQSPSPYKNTTDACPNVVVGVRFTVDMDRATMIPANVLVRRCNAGEFFDRAACNAEIRPDRLAFIDAERLLTFEDGTLDASTWYEVTLRSGGIAGADGVALDGDTDGEAGGDYVWSFKTRPEGAPCAVDHVELSPARAAIRALNGTQDFRADPTAANCNRLLCAALPFDWSARLRDGGLAGAHVRLESIPGAPSCEERATGLRETDTGNPIIVRAETVEEKFDTSELAIQFLRPEVVDFWPGCREACREAEVGARFNIPMEPSSITTANIKIFSCTNESCNVFDDPSGMPGVGVTHAFNENDQVIGFTLTGTNLLRDHYYRVRIRGGRVGALSLSGSVLNNGNDGADFTWIFKTKEDAALCDVDRVALQPARGNVYVVGDTGHFASVAFGAPDSCEPETGQRLNPFSYNWSWGVETVRAVVPPAEGQPLPVVARIDFSGIGGKNILPLVGPGRSGPGCTAQCLNIGTLSNVSVCGNGGAPEPGEDCDDGAARDGDGCSSRCLSEGASAPLCGDGDRDRGEDCDDGNARDGDGCSARCVNEGSAAGGSVCGNGDVGDGEDCDDGNARNADGCSAQCLNEGSVPGPLPVCGNGIIEAGEDCDPGDADAPGADGRDLDGCTERCRAIGTPACAGEDRVGCCGNGEIETGELCDDGPPARDGDGCSVRCLLEGSSSRYGLSFATASFCGAPVTVLPARPPLQTGEACEFTGSPDAKYDPDAFARAEFGGTSLVTATMRNAAGAPKSGSADFNVICACTTDASCTAFLPGSRIPPQGVGCGIGACCYSRPFVEPGSLTPADGEADVCRNALVAFNFDQQMDHGSLIGNILLAEPSDRPCDAGKETPEPGFCVSPLVGEIVPMEITVSGRIKTRVEFRPSAAFGSDTRPARYAVIAKGDQDRADERDEGVLSARGVGLDRDYFAWSFTTGTEICTLDLVTVDPDSWLFSRARESRDFLAHPRTRRPDGRTPELSSIPNVYAWTWAWTSSDREQRSIERPSSVLPLAVIQTVAAPQNGQAVATAFARVSMNVLGAVCTVGAPAAEIQNLCGTGRSCAAAPGDPQGHCVGEIKSGASEITVLLCENPWPARAPDGSWEPYQHPSLNFSTYYCRDAGRAADISDDLPAPTPVVAAGTPFLFDLLLPMQCEGAAPGLCLPGDALGVRVARNDAHVSATRWFAEQGFPGSPASRTVDGYEAVQEGRTVYVNAGNKVGDPTIFTNIYLITFNEGAGDALQGIYRQAIDHISFNTNITASNARVCSADLAVGCTTDAECANVAGGVCLAAKDKLIRDVKRLADFKEVEAALERYYATHVRCSVSGVACITDETCPAGEQCVGSYPGLEAGSFIRALSTSRWPSWQATLGSALGIALPADPVNNAFGCSEGADQGTCFNASSGTYQCSGFSSLYHYKKEGRRYVFGANLELRFCEDTDALCRTDDDCGGVARCLLPTWRVNPEPRDHAIGATPIDNQFDGAFCPETGRSFGAGQVCGDGAVGPGEECEIGQSRLTACSVGAPVRNGFRREVCRDNCTWDASAACAVGSCGDGVIQGPDEVCDDGAANGSYGRCALDCRGFTAAHCGDGERQVAEELCDFGGRCSDDPALACANDDACRAAGAGRCLGATRYGVAAENSCSFDCRSRGPFCGDRAVSPEYGEECEVGAVETSIEGCPIVLGRQWSKRRTCPAICTWPDDAREGWSDCAASESCGDGAVQAAAGEECDDGNRDENDGCTRLCRRNICGDGILWSGREGCDEGARNVRPDDAGEIARRRDACPYGTICNYCTTNCTPASLSGPTCGDRVINGPEICEADVNGNDLLNDPVDRAAWLPAGGPYSAASLCANDCRTACPPAYATAQISFRAKRLDDPHYYQNRFVNEITIRPSDEQSWGISLPACRVSASLAVQSNILLTARPELSIVFIADLSGGMDDCIDGSRKAGSPLACPPGVQTKLEAARDQINASVDRLLDVYPPGSIHVGILGFSSSNRTDPEPDGWFDVDPPSADGSDPWDNKSAVAETRDLRGNPTLLDGSSRATIHAAVNALRSHNSDHAGVGFVRAQEMLRGAPGKRMIAFLSDGESKCGDPGRFDVREGGAVGDEAAPVCYSGSRVEVKKITEPLATAAAEDVKADATADPIKIFTAALRSNCAPTENAVAQMRFRSSECKNARAYRRADGSLRWTAVGGWESGIDEGRDCTRRGTPQYFQYAYCGTDLTGMYENIVSALVTFSVEVVDEHDPANLLDDVAAVTSPVEEGISRSLTLPRFDCDPARGKDFAFRLRSPLDLEVRFSEVGFNLCRP